MPQIIKRLNYMIFFVICQSIGVKLCQIVNNTSKLQLSLQFKMGQALIEGCESNCQGKYHQQRSKVRSYIYFSNLSAHLPTYQQHSDLTHSVATRNKNGHFLQQIKHVPTEYVEFINYLFVNKIKFEDTVFPADAEALAFHGAANCQWARLSDMNEQVAAIFKQIGGGTRSKVFHLLCTLQSFSGLETYKPIYVPKVGMAICCLHINGQREDVVVDDLIPTFYLKYYTPETYWFFIIEKALAKILGSYSLLQEFSVHELFQQITGLPYELQNRGDWSTRDSYLGTSNLAEKPQFQDVIRSDDACYLPSQRQGEVCYVRFIKGFTVKSLPVTATAQMASLFKMRVDRGGKISVRVSLLNWKFMSTQHKKLGQWTIKLYRQEGEQYNQVQDKILTIDNNIYLGSTFLHLKAGRYIICLQTTSNTDRCNLVWYAADGTVTLAELQPGQSFRDTLQKIATHSH